MSRNLLLFFFIAFNIQVIQAQVPEFVVSAFEAGNPQLSSANWKIEGTTYMVLYTDSLHLNYRNVYNSNGILMMRESELVKEQIPLSIYEYCATHFPGTNTGKVWLLEKHGAGKYYYTIMGDIALLFDEGGYFTGMEGRPLLETRIENELE